MVTHGRLLQWRWEGKMMICWIPKIQAATTWQPIAYFSRQSNLNWDCYNQSKCRILPLDRKWNIWKAQQLPASLNFWDKGFYFPATLKANLPLRYLLTALTVSSRRGGTTGHARLGTIPSSPSFTHTPHPCTPRLTPPCTNEAGIELRLWLLSTYNNLSSCRAEKSGQREERPSERQLPR